MQTENYEMVKKNHFETISGAEGYCRIEKCSEKNK